MSQEAPPVRKNARGSVTHAVETYSQLDPTQKSGLKTFVKQMSCNMYPTAYLQREWEVG